MSVYKRGYQRYRGPLTGRLARFMAVPRFAWQRLFQQRLVIILLVASLIFPLLCFAYIYLANHSELWVGLPEGFKSALRIDGRLFYILMSTQSVFAIFLAALAGPGLIAPDLANNALPLYFSRPMTRIDYVLARLIVLAGILSIVTWVPGLLLFGIQTGMGGWEWFSKNWTIAPSVFAGFAAWVLFVSLVALASSAYVKWRVIAGALVLGFFFILASVGQMVNAVFRVDWGRIIDPAYAMNHLWRSMLGWDISPDDPSSTACVIALLVVSVLLALVLERKLRPVEVIS